MILGLWDMYVYFGGGLVLIEENKVLLLLYIVYGIIIVCDCFGDLFE